MARSAAPVLVLGELDGMHRGHRRLLDAGATVAARTGRRCEVVVFDVEARDRVLTEPGERARRVLGRGITSCRVLGIPADGVDADSLAAQIVDTCDPAALVMACASETTVDDHRYPDVIAAFRRRGLEVVEVDRVRDRRGVVSSGRVRDSVDRGDVADARALVGAAYTIGGEVQRGQQLGRTIGFPTANLEPPARRVLPRRGVYAARVTLPGGRRMDAAVNVGVRPTVEAAGRTLIEAHLLDFDGELYGRWIDVAFITRIRGERRFDGLDALTAQLRHDVASTRALLAADSIEPWFG